MKPAFMAMEPATHIACIFITITTFFTFTDARSPMELLYFKVTEAQQSSVNMFSDKPDLVSLPPLESLPPLPLPSNIPPFCLNPPFSPPTIPLPPHLPIKSPPTYFLGPPTYIPNPKPHPCLTSPPHNLPGPPMYIPNLKPPTHQLSPPKTVPPPPHLGPSTPPKHTPSPSYKPPVIYPPPTGKKPQFALWCVAKPTVPDPVIQEALDYACGSGTDCKAILPKGPCFQPNNLFAHASYAFNSYWQNAKNVGGTCDFGGTAMLVTVDPSFDECHFICK